MKIKHVLLTLTAVLFFACTSTSDDSNTEVPNDENQDNDETSGIINETVQISVVNAFENLTFDSPLDLQSANDGSQRIFVAEKGGRIKVFDNNTEVSTAEIFLDLSGGLSITSEQGLLGFAFHPNYASNGYVYVCYNPTTAVSYISRFTVSSTNANQIALDSELVLLEIPQPATNHNGGQLAFGPDGFLYISSGDGGGARDPDNNAQNRGNLLGNILRIDVDNTANGMNYSIPPDNPFVGENGVREEIYAYGLRNPWRMAFDPETGDLWTGDVGQGALEEINTIVSGGNYGWKLFEGTACFFGDCDATGLLAPIFEYNHDNGDRSITGGYVYRGSTNASLRGKYIYGDFVSGRIWALNSDGSDNLLLTDTNLNISSFGTDENQELYVCDFGGAIYKFVESPIEQ